MALVTMGNGIKITLSNERVADILVPAELASVDSSSRMTCPSFNRPAHCFNLLWASAYLCCFERRQCSMLGVQSVWAAWDRKWK